jgi:dihydroneopterin aldolase
VGADNRCDRITLAGVRLHPRIGVTAEERQVPQECQADVSIWGDFEAAASADAIEKSFDYCEILAAVIETAHAREYHLVESLAYRICRQVVQKFSARRVQVRVRKRPAELMDQLDFIEVETEHP